ncbi:MAG: hypothetical protein IIC53_14690 [Proteobacteria bacterium]|nr:hypothetical protein [Pseudomonadota bacterium]
MELAWLAPVLSALAFLLIITVGRALPRQGAFLAPLAALRDICDQTKALLIVDEAHAVGAPGPKGAGICALAGVVPDALVGAALLWSTAIASSVTDNVPLAAVMGNILQDLNQTPDFQWWATIFGTNLGGNFTPIGSASTVVAVAIIHRAKLPLTFLGFVAKAAPFAIAQLILATAYVLVFLR